MKQETKFKDTEIGLIPEEWGVKSIGEICKVRRGASPRPIHEYISEEGIPWVKISDATSQKTRFIDWTNEFIKIEGKSKSVSVNPGDLIVSNSATPGLPKFMRINACIHDGWLLIDTGTNCDKQFIYYMFIHQRDKLVGIADGTVFKNLKTDIVRNYIFAFPPLQEQKSIAKILSDLDSKIELLQKQNKTLEAIGQAIFKHWFVDFEFPDEGGKPYKSSGGEMVFNEELGKEIPKRWGVKSLDEIADYLNGLALQKYPPKDEVYLPVIKIKELRQGITTQSDKANPNIDKNYIINNGDILFSWSGSLMVVIWGGGKGALNQHLFKVTSKNFEKWFYYYWTKRHLEKFIGIAKDKATTMGHIKRKHLAESKVLVPNKGIMEKMNKIIEPVIYKIISNKVGVIRFQKTRDLLLPKLMSGEVRIDV